MIHPPTYSKYRNVKTTIDGITFDSKAEAARYCELKIAKSAGEVRWFVRQVGFDLPGNVRYRADFLVVWADGRVSVEDVKGTLTALYRLKKRQVEALYGVEITEIKYDSRDVNRLLMTGITPGAR